MNCNDIHPLLEEYAAGELPPGVAAEVARHLSACGECNALADRYSALFASLAASRAAHRDAQVPTRLLPGVNARIDARERRYHDLLLPLRFATGFAAGLAVIALIFMFGLNRPAVDSTTSMRAELQSVVGPADSTAVAGVDQFVTDHQVITTALPSIEISPTAQPLNEEALADAMFADMKYEDVVYALTDYLGNDNLLDLYAADYVQSND